METLLEYTQRHVLVIPQALFAMPEVRTLFKQQSSAILYKQLERDLANIEFYTNTPCLIFIDAGYEEITTSDNRILGLSPGSALFLPQGLNLHSDYVRKATSLKAFMVFFEEAVITGFLSRCARSVQQRAAQRSYCLVDRGGDVFRRFFASLETELQTPAYVRLKLDELLQLFAWRAGDSDFMPLLQTMQHQTPKRNLVRLLEQHDLIHLSVQDLARLSGRSLSTFNRDFKAIYQVTPKRWLQDKRLTRARRLLADPARTVTQVAGEVGYDNVSNFIKAFKTKFGDTPHKVKNSRAS